MSISIVVTRGAGDNQGADIIDPLISTLPVALARGRVAIEDQGSNLQPVTLQTVYRSGVFTGQTVEVLDSFQGEVWYGKVIGIRHSVGNGQYLTQLTIRRPRL